jgi:hypothetical protein
MPQVGHVQADVEVPAETCRKAKYLPVVDLMNAFTMTNVEVYCYSAVLLSTMMLTDLL